MTSERITEILEECVADVDRILQYLEHKTATEARFAGANISAQWEPSVLVIELFKARIQQEYVEEAEDSWEEGSGSR